MRIREYLSRHGVRAGLSLAVLALLLFNSCGLLQLGMVERLENFSYDQRLNWMMPATVDTRIVIVDIDERSLQQQGHWPWGRNKLAQLVDRLFDDYHIRMLGFDVVFAEADDSSGLRNLQRLTRQDVPGQSGLTQALARLTPEARHQLDYDGLFAASLRGRDVVLGYYFTHAEDATAIGTLPPPALRLQQLQGRDVVLRQASGFGANLPDLQSQARGAGHFNPDPDRDGITRKIPMLVQYRDGLYPALSLEMARILLRQQVMPGFAQGLGVDAHYAGLEWLQLGERRIPVDAEVATLIPFRGRQGSFRYVSATDVLTGRVDARLLRDRIVLVGTTAPGLMDLRATPVQSVYAGVEVHANMLSAILDRHIQQRPAYERGAEFLQLLLTGCLLLVLMPLLSPLRATLLAALLTAFSLAMNLALWRYQDMVLPLASSLLLILSVYVLNMSYGFFFETRAKRQLAGLFGQYVPSELVDEMAKDPDSFSLEGQSRALTVLFSDIRGFTGIAEGMEPRQLTQLMQEFLTPMTQVIHHHRGTIDKYMGDAIMAFWGAPVADAQHARHALEAAMRMLESLPALRARFAARGWPQIDIGIGLNTGMMTVGNMGSQFRMAYTVMGDAVNLGARLESLTKYYGVSLIVSEATVQAVPDYLFRELDRVQVKGKAKPVAIFEPICGAIDVDAATLQELRQYQQALASYRAQAWGPAQVQFSDLQNINPKRYLYHVYLERIASHQRHPPQPGWDGVFVHESK